MCLLVQMRDIFVLFDLLAVHHIFIRLWNDSDQEVKQNNNYNKLIHPPNCPNQINLWLWNVCEWRISWVIDIANWILPNIEKHSNEITVFECCPWSSLHSTLDVKHDKDKFPENEIGEKWYHIKQACLNQIHKQSELFINPQEEI